MKRFLSLWFITFAVIAEGMVLAPLAHAQTPDITAQTAQAAYQTCMTNGGTGDQCQAAYDAYAAAAKISNNPADAAALNAAQQTPTDLNKNTDDSYNIIMIKIMSLFAWLVGVAALTLDWTVYYTVLNMGAYVHNLTAIGITWRILRDIGNILLIFGFLAIGLSIILNTEKLGYGRKMLPMLLLAAVFLNFSLFFAEAIIDAGNLFATQFYTQINGGTAPTPTFLSQLTVSNEGISNKLMAQLGLVKLYGPASSATTDKAKAAEIFKQGNPWIIGFLGIILFIVTAFVLFSLAFLFVARFVVLIYLIILAPIGFAGLAVPQLAGRAKDWWHQLFTQTISAPVLLLMLYIALAVITDTKFLSGLNPGQNADWLGSVGSSNLAGFAGILLTFLIAMGLLIFVTIMAKSLSAAGAGAISKITDNAKNKLINTGMAPVRFAGRAASNTGRWAVRSSVGRGLYTIGQAVRTSGAGQTQAGRIVAGVFDKGGKGFKEAKEKSTKMHEEYVKTVGTAIDNKNAARVLEAAQTRAAITEAPNKEIKAAKETIAASTALAEEVKRLEKLVKSNEDAGRTGFAVTEAKTKLMEAQRAAQDNQPVEAQARKQLADAEKKVATALKTEESVTNDVTKQKKEASLAYAQNLQTSLTQNPFTYFASGKGGNAAAMKIIKDSVKVSSDEQKALETLKKAITPTSAAEAPGENKPSAGH